ncbi:MAG: NAD(P)-dependent oxidoreductase [Candidatus Aegiribacteria sp.]
MGLRVLMDGDWDEHRLQRLKDLLREDVSLSIDPSGGDYQVLVSGRPAPELVTAPGLRCLLIPWAGLPGETRRLMMSHRDVSVHNIHHNAASAAELALGLMLAAARRIVVADSHLRRGDWTPRYRQEDSILVSGSGVLVLGYGHLGEKLGEACSALGATVRGIRRSVTRMRMSGSVTLHPPESLHLLLEDSDIVFLCLPLTDETRGIMGSAELSLMHERSILVNVGRGALVDEEALYRSLATGSIGAAGIDVWYSYPSSPEERCSTQPSRYPFSELDNVVMTPHMGGAFGSEMLERSRTVQLAESINAFADKGEMPWKVDLDRGY